MKIKTVFDVLTRVSKNPANKGHRVMPLVRFAGWQAYKRVTKRHYDAHVWGGQATLRCYPDSAIASSVLYAHSGLADFHEMMFLRHYLRSGDHFLDIGSNIGIYTLFAATLNGPNGQIVSFEPDELARSRLCENIEINKLKTRVSIHPVALTDTTGTLRFTCGRDATNQIQTDDDDTNAIKVACARLDDETRAADGQRLQFAAGKIDIEGAEPLAFAGAPEMLANANPPVWIIEINGRLRSFGTTEDQFEAWLAERNYTFALYDGRRRILRHAPAAWKHAQNVIAVHKNHWNNVVERVSS